MLCFLNSTLQAQHKTSTLTDTRDGNVYTTIMLDSLEWMRENLRLETAWSHHRKDSISGGYYSVQERDSICPAGWRIPLMDEWHAMLNAVLDDPTWVVDSLNMWADSSVYWNLDSLGARMIHWKPSHEGLFTDTLLHLRPYGWKEGPWIRNKKTLTLWVDRHGLSDPRFHVHQSNGQYLHHTHPYHLQEGYGRPRRFNARCVREVEK